MKIFKINKNKMILPILIYIQKQWIPYTTNNKTTLPKTQNSKFKFKRGSQGPNSHNNTIKYL